MTKSQLKVYTYANLQGMVHISLSKPTPNNDTVTYYLYNMADLTTFHPFSELPIELRLKIWLEALPLRVVEPKLDCDCEPHSEP